MTTLGIEGGLTVDHLVTEGTGTRFRCLGGPGLFAALGALVVAGTQVRLHAQLPDDEPRFEALLRRTGVDIRFCLRTPKALRLWILNSTEGRRILPTSSPDGLELAGTHLDPDSGDDAGPSGFFEGLDGLLLSSPRLPLHALKRAPVVGVDPDQRAAMLLGFDYWMALAEQATVLLPSRVQLRQIHDDARDAARMLATRTGRPVIARLDSDGLLVIDGGQAWTVQDPEVRVVDTIGAGDASAAAIVAALASGSSLIESAAFGASAARLVLSDWGHDGLLLDGPLTRPYENLITKEL
ncbi:carbohydrate kinase family protein [Arthrobacter sp. 35W]|uniref:carbohydrate kinase family protein n=1 Tax=Arthrobacter sp. 35W TaxID=1132441 RepID=UPI00040C5BB2|nr:carbohydrate kinase family protein [Arthrobacter sp. 35W]